MDNSRYWKDKEQRVEFAKKHIQEMAKYPIGTSRVYRAENDTPSNPSDIVLSQSTVKYTANMTQQSIMACDTVSALYNLDIKGKICILNFASYKEPGGKFLEGSSAQEESLCMESNLYNILAEQKDYYALNNTCLNRGLYLDRAIYSDNVIFIRNGIRKEADVLTCAAPNNSIGIRYGSFTDAVNIKALTRRIHFIRMVMQENHVNHAILGAYGCGVFGQDAYVVANSFKNEFRDTGINVTYAVPGNIDSYNLRAFKAVFEGTDL